MAWTRVAELRDLPDEGGLRVRLGDQPVGLFRVGDAVYAMDDVCPHAGHALSGGFLDGACIICPAHLWEFDVRTGLPPGVPGGERLRCFPVRVEDGAVWVDPDRALEPEAPAGP